MKQKTLNLMEEAISAAGEWVWMEIAIDSIQLEFTNVQLYSPKLNESEPHSSTIAIRFSDNVFFKVFFPEENYEKLAKDFFNPFSEISYSLNNQNFKFQDFKLFEKLKKDFPHQKDLKVNSNNNNNNNNIQNGEIDFLLCFKTDKVAVATGGNQIQFFNEFNVLNDEEIKKLSNKWWVYWVDYWKNKNHSYEYDIACEVYPLLKSKKDK